MAINIPDLFEKAFSGEYHRNDEKGSRYDFYTLDLGMLSITDGRIIVCDPYSYSINDNPIGAIFPTGDFPVELAVGQVDDDERVTFARINFSPATPVRWEMAVPEEEDASTLQPGEIFGYPVNAGTGCFMDMRSAKELLAYLSDKEQDNLGQLSAEINRNYRHARSWLLWQKNGCTAAMFSSGWGDGFYASYIGYDADDNICRLVTDFGIFVWPAPVRGHLRVV